MTPLEREAAVATKYDWPAAGDRSIIGTRYSRIDGPSKSRGAAKYAYDRNLDKMVYARLVTSPHAHANIKSIDTSRAEASEAVLAAGGAADGAIAVWLRNARVWSRTWKTSLVGSVGEPLFYFVGLGYGLGTLIPSVAG